MIEPLSPKRDRVASAAVVAIAVLVALFICLCCCGIVVGLSAYMVYQELEPTPQPAPAITDFRPLSSSDTAQSLVQQIAGTQTTDTDYWLLYGQLENEAGEPAIRGYVQEPPVYQEGDVHTFWMGDEENQRYWQIDARLEIKTDHAYLYVSEETTFDQDELRQAADLFESQIYPTNRQYFGTEWSPGIDNDTRVTILVTDQMPPGIAGYFSSGDEYPGTMKPRSNEREMIYVTSSYLSNTADFGQLLSHEFQHMIHWNQDLSESLWINEGLSLLAEEVNGYPSVLGGWQFWRDPDIQLTNWSEDANDRYRNYAASKLFLSYLGEQYGGYTILAKLAVDQADGIDSVNNLLQSEGYAVGFADVFSDWVLANLINDAAVGDGRYSYTLRGSDEPKFSTTLETETEYAGWVQQFGADYIEIDSRAGSQILFQGSGLSRLAGTDVHDGQFAWWSNRRNMLNSSLTQRIDLRDVESATLRFWTWYDIEEHFDYGYVAVSTDDGRTWTTIPGTHSTSDDPNNANYGHGYTGKSQGWLQEQVDLGSFAGQEILLRFWYISDPGLNQPGWLIDDIAIPEIGFADDAEQDGSGWTAEGFVRSSNDVPQSYIVQLVEYGPQTTVRRLSLDDTNRAEITLAEDTRRAVLVVSGATQWTSQAAPYRVKVTP
ncbi:MAG: immune inhibitor A [Anaerolineae bacterium]|nr:immune inhibitor A [Anaerolineae bacterium]